MGFFKNLFSKRAKPARPNQLVRLHIPEPAGQASLDAGQASLEVFNGVRGKWAGVYNRLEEILRSTGGAEVDGDEFGGGEYTIWMYGSDSRRLAETVKAAAPTLGLPTGCSLYIVHGSGDDAERSKEPLDT